MKHTLITVPVQPPVAYVGGKKLLAKTLTSQIETISHKSYIEPFCGMGGVFFRRRHPVTCEVINDRSGEVVNFFRIIQRHYGAFEDLLRFSISSRDEFDRLEAVDPKHLTDIERALRFFYLQSLAFGGHVRGQAFGVRNERSAGLCQTKLRVHLQAISDRLSRVTIENLDYRDCIRRYDKPHALFYLDPPYWGTEHCYGQGMFDRSDFEDLANILSGIKGRFILSINDVPEIRELFSDFDVRSVELNYTLSRSNTTRAKELIISN